MHPPLTPANHPLCKDVIAALHECHAANPWAKLLGACNEPKWALDACFKEEARVCGVRRILFVVANPQL
jgi:hypothetical protein